MRLEELGWRREAEEAFAEYAAQGLEPARVVRRQGTAVTVLAADGERGAELAGRLRHEAGSRSELPVVGDWVAVRPVPGEAKAVIHAVLARRTRFSRRAAGDVVEEQVVAANIDTVFFVSGLDGDFNLRRIERYLALGEASGARPVVILNKADLCPDVESACARALAAAPGIPVHAVSAREKSGLDVLAAYLAPGETVALLGSSGAGKSTIINALLGEERLRVQEVRESDSRGRHTTSHRELIVLPGGAMVIDTPGLREIQLWTDEETLRDRFGDILALAEDCRFRDCTHEKEPGCAVRRAVEEGTLDEARFENFRRMRREVKYLARQQDERLRRDEKMKWKRIHKGMRALKKIDPRYS